ncbi:MAG: BamA/TamA family outer membrane protein [Cyanobacteria bacterium J06627_8]
MKKVAIASGYTAVVLFLGGVMAPVAIARPELARYPSADDSVLVAEADPITAPPPSASAWDAAQGPEQEDGVLLYPEESEDETESVESILIYPEEPEDAAHSSPSSSTEDNASVSGDAALEDAASAAQEGERSTPSPPLLDEAPPTQRNAPEPDEMEILLYPDIDDSDAMETSPTAPSPREQSEPSTPGLDPRPEPGLTPNPFPFPAEPSISTDLPEGAIATSIRVEGVNPELQQAIRDVIQLREGQPLRSATVEADSRAIAGTGLFESVDIATIPNADGVTVVYRATPIVVRSFHLIGSQVIPPDVFSNAFDGQVNQPISPRQLNQGADRLDAWYVENGYSLSTVVAWLTDSSGQITVEVVEPTIGAIDFQFVEDGSSTDANGEQVEGRTRQDFILRELGQQPGDVFNQNALRQDLEKLLSLGVFQDASIELIPNETPETPTVDLLYRLEEGFARSVRVGGGISTELGLFGAVNYRDRNFRGIGEDINLGIQAGGRGLEFNTGYTSPYRESRPNRLGYSVNGFRRSNQSLTFSDEVSLANGDDARERRFGGGASVMRPLGEWDAELGLNYARVSIRDDDGDIATEDELGNSLTASDSGIDDLLTLGFQVTQDRRLNPNNPAGGSILSFGTEQSIPIGSGNILLNRITANYARFVPTDVFGSGSLRNPEVLAFNVRGGTVLGELPPYEAFDLGGANSVRGYGGGDVGSGRSFFLASAEYRFPIVATLGGVLFTDFASDLGTGSSVEGDPAGSRDKPGTGFGYGVGLRFGSPIGLIRADFGFNDQGDNRFHFGFGQRF